MPAARPSLTTRGQAWLTNFLPSDQAIATLLVDSLDIVSSEDVQTGLRRCLDDLKAVRQAPIALIPVRASEDLPEADRHIAYETFDPGGPVTATPGSEAIVGSWIREFVNERPGREKSGWIHPSASLDRLREQKCRTILLVTDYAGSGQQIIDFARSFVRHPTIRSWRSFGWLRIFAVAFAVSQEAQLRLEVEPALDGYFAVRPATSFSTAQWTNEERESIMALCTNYLGPGEQSQRFGFGGSGGLFVIQSRVPNNVPQILRRRSTDWQPFFERRRVPQDLIAELGSYISQRDLPRLAHETKQIRLSKALTLGRLASPADELAATLALLRRHRLNESQLAFRLNKSHARIVNLLVFLRRMNLVSADMRLTDRGKAELRAAKRLERIATASLEENDSPYYPQALR